MKSTGTAAPSGRESLLCWQVGATMVPMIRTPCPTCGTPVMATHRCPGRTIDPPTPRPPEFWDWVAEARAELEAESRRRAVVQETLPLDDVDGVSSGP